MARLIGRTGAVAGQDFMLSDSMRIGAAGENDIRIAVEGVSRRHARVFREGDHFLLEDTGATNGTFLNGFRVQRETLRHLDVVTLGRNVDLIFLSRENEPPPAPDADQLIEVKLEFVDGAEAGTAVDVPRGEFTLGRAPSCNVVLNSPAVGRAHARIERSAKRLLIQDLQSANGTFVNGQRIDGTAVLSSGDVVGLGGVRSLTVRIKGTPSPLPAVAGPPTPETRPVNQEWKTRFMWGPEELAQIEAARAEAIARAKLAAPGAAAPGKPAAGVRRPAAAAPGSPAAPAGKPAAGAPGSPAAPAGKPAPGAAAAPGVPAAKPAAAAAPGPPAAAAPGAPAAKPAAPAVAGPGAPEAAAPAAAPPGVPVAKPAAAAAAAGDPSAKPAAAAAPVPSAPAPKPAAAPPASPAAPAPGAADAAAVASKAAAAPPAAAAIPVAPPADVPAAPAAAASPGAAAPAAPPVAKPAPPPAAAKPAAPAPPPRDVPTSAVTVQLKPESARVSDDQTVRIPPAARRVQGIRLVGPGGPVRLGLGAFKVGRAVDADVRLEDRQVSRAHALLVVDDASALIEDLKTVNGTLVNGQEVKGRQPLKSGDTVRFGDSEFTVELIT